MAKTLFSVEKLDKRAGQKRNDTPLKCEIAVYQRFVSEK